MAKFNWLKSHFRIPARSPQYRRNVEIAPPTPWELLLSDANLVVRISGDSNNDGIGDVLDSTGNYNGTWGGTPTYADPPVGIPGKAIDTVSGRYVTFSNAAMTGLPSWTVCGWIKPRVMADANSPWLGAISSNTAPCIRMLGAKWQCYCWDAVGGNAITGLVTNVNVIAVDRWDHISFGYNGTTAFLHWNGTDVTGTGTVVAGKVVGNNLTFPLRIGGGTAGSGTPFNGFTADTRIYSRALTLAESLVLATGI